MIIVLFKTPLNTEQQVIKDSKQFNQRKIKTG